jgi:hypothetical protein
MDAMKCEACGSAWFSAAAAVFIEQSTCLCCGEALALRGKTPFERPTGNTDPSLKAEAR